MANNSSDHNKTCLWWWYIIYMDSYFNAHIVINNLCRMGYTIVHECHDVRPFNFPLLKMAYVNWQDTMADEMFVHWGPMTSNDDSDLGQQCFRYWNVA